VLSYRPRLANGLFISPSMKRVIVPLHWAQHATTGRAGRTDQTRYTASDRPTPSTCPPKINHDCSILQRSLRANGQTQSTGRAAQSTGRADRAAPAHAMHRPDALHSTTGHDSVWSRSRELPSRLDTSDQLFATREGERNSNPSLLPKLHRLHKCANTNKCSSSCARVLAFSQSFYQRS
jgi:hypothetical protein